MLDYKKIACALDSIAEKVEASGLTDEALALDKVADALEAMGNFPPQALQLAKELGITLNKQNAADIVKQYLGKAPVDEAGMKEALALNPKLRSLAMLATILAAGFVADVAAKGSPINITFDNGMIQTYTAKDLKNLEKSDPKTFSIVMDQYEKQQAQAASQSEISQTTQNKAQKATQPGYGVKPTKNIEDLKDQFGNEARLITYTDGSKSMEGDIYHGGVSLRDKLTRSGEISPDPSAKSLERR